MTEVINISAENRRKITMDPEQMKALGYRVIDMIVDNHQTRGDRPLIRNIDGSNPGVDILGKGFSAEGKDPLEILDVVKTEILSDMLPNSDSRFFGYVPSPSNFVGAMADAISAGFNVFAGTTVHNHGPTQVERSCINWLKNLVGFPEAAGGTFVSGGSVANLTGLIIARHQKLGEDIADAVVYCSDETHSCIKRAMKISGFRADQLVCIPTDADLKLNTVKLREKIYRDKQQGKRPFLIIGTLGTTSSGAVDSLDELADISEQENLWFHVDAAYGGGAILSERKSALVKGVERADSVAMDQHKWFFQPFECGTILVRDRKWLHDFFHELPAYLKDSKDTGESFNFRDYGIQLTRSFRALKLWMSLQTFGQDAFRDAVEHGLSMAEYAEEMLREESCWEVVSAATLGIITFRYRREGMGAKALNELNDRINKTLVSSGNTFMTTTEIKGDKVLRLCTINPRHTRTDIREIIYALKDIGDHLTA